MNNFLKQWDTDSDTFKLKGIHLHRAPPIRQQLTSAIYRIRVQQSKLESTSMRMQQHDKEIFAKCVSAQMAHEAARAAIYANECAEVRKIAKVTLQSQLALEQVAIRLETIEEFGDVARMMGPVASVIRSVKGQISGIIPEVGFELNQVGEMLNSFAAEAGEPLTDSFEVGTSNEEAQRILGEANAIAEQHIREKFPELPASRSQRLGESLSH
jgi:division protein CdvB (Snf7/Vps24/ESCRT-III family)